MQGSDVTVTVTNWNGRHYLDGCLESIFAQTVQPAEVVLVDNASDDGSVEHVTEHWPAVRIVSLPTNEGPCPARNAGLEAANTPLVFSVDNDALLAPDCLERLLPHLRDDVVIVHPRSVFDSEPDRVHYDGADMHFVGMMTLHNFYGALEDAVKEPHDLDAAISVALLMDREKSLAAGGYDPAHFILFEDHDLSYRIRARGGRIVLEPGAIVRHKEGTAGISFREKGSYSRRRVFLHSRNRWIVLIKCHGWRALLLGLPGIALYELAYLFFAVRDGGFGAWMRGKIEVLQLLPKLLGQRREIQKSRVVPDRELLKARPLTVSPLIKRGGLVRKLQSSLDLFFRAWWRLVGWMV